MKRSMNNIENIKEKLLYCQRELNRLESLFTSCTSAGCDSCGRVTNCEKRLSIVVYKPLKSYLKQHIHYLQEQLKEELHEDDL